VSELGLQFNLSAPQILVPLCVCECEC